MNEPRMINISSGWAAMPLAGEDEGRRLIDRIPSIPLRSRLYGPLVARRLRLFYAFLALVAVGGMLPVLTDATPAWKAFGLGIVFPGAGFLYAGGVLGAVFAAASLALFAASMFYWWARGILPLPPLTVVGTAALAAAYVGSGSGWAWVEWAAPLGLAFTHMALARQRQQKFQQGLAQAKAVNDIIPTVAPLLRDRPTVARPEMTAPQIAEFRRMLDLALQPVDEWKGFTTDDKWQQGSLRYQIATPSWNLAMCQYSQLPAFHGYLNQAQQNLIRKHIDRKTWDYWRYESLWGNFSYAKDPIRYDNIMLSGFLALSVGMFETASGTSAFAAPGTLTFRWDEDTAFAYSHSSLCQTLVDNYQRYDLGWFVCEPRWIYSMCNLVGLNALLLHDARHGTRYAAQVMPRFKRTMEEEMQLSDGRLRVCTSSLFGFTVPSLSGLFGEAWGVRFMTSFAPGDAERLWEVLKRQFIAVGDDGQVQYKLLELGWDTRQPSDFRRWADINPLVVTLWSALEMGDTELIEGISRKMDAKYGAGTAESMTWGTTNTIRDMVTRGLPDAWRTGPILAEAVYPDVIVTRAVSDGAALNLVLHPGAGEVDAQLGLARLKPNTRYRVAATGQEFQAGAEGKATLTIALRERTQLDIVPVI
jgi:hypothetical protein